MTNEELSTIRYTVLIKTIIICFILYIPLMGYMVFENERTQKEIQANFYGLEIESDGKGASPNSQKPYICVEKDANLTYTHECTGGQWGAKIFIRLIISFFFSWLWFFLVPIRIPFFILIPVSIFFLMYWFEKRKFHKKYDP